MPVNSTIINFGSRIRLKDKNMPMIEVKAAEGRVAYDAPYGKRIASDKYTLVKDTPYIRRLINHHGDLIAKRGTDKPAPMKPIASDPAQPAVKTDK